MRQPTPTYGDHGDNRLEDVTRVRSYAGELSIRMTIKTPNSRLNHFPGNIQVCLALSNSRPGLLGSERTRGHGVPAGQEHCAIPRKNTGPAGAGRDCQNSEN